MIELLEGGITPRRDVKEQRQLLVETLSLFRGLGSDCGAANTCILGKVANFID